METLIVHQIADYWAATLIPVADRRADGCPRCLARGTEPERLLELTDTNVTWQYRCAACGHAWRCAWMREP